MASRKSKIEDIRHRREQLSDGSLLEIHEIKLPGIREHRWTVLRIFPDNSKPEIRKVDGKVEAQNTFASILRADVLELV